MASHVQFTLSEAEGSLTFTPACRQAGSGFHSIKQLVTYNKILQHESHKSSRAVIFS